MFKHPLQPVHVHYMRPLVTLSSELPSGPINRLNVISTGAAHGFVDASFQ